MGEMTNIGNAIELLEQNDKCGKLALSLIDSFQQLPKWFHMAFLGGCIMLVAYGVHEGYGVCKTEKGWYITRQDVILTS